MIILCYCGSQKLLLSSMNSPMWYLILTNLFKFCFLGLFHTWYFWSNILLINLYVQSQWPFMYGRNRNRLVYLSGILVITRDWAFWATSTTPLLPVICIIDFWVDNKLLCYLWRLTGYLWDGWQNHYFVMLLCSRTWDAKIFLRVIMLS